MKKNIYSYGLLFLIIGCIIGIPLNSLGASVEEYKTAKDRLAKTNDDIKKLEQSKKKLQQEYEDAEAEAKDWVKKKNFSTQNIEGATGFIEAAEQEMAEIKEKQEELDQQKEELLATKEKQENQVKASIPPPPWKTHKPPAANDFETQKKQAYENYQWFETFALTKKGREGARGMYIKDMAKIEKAEAAVKKAKAKKEAEKAKKEAEKAKKEAEAKKSEEPKKEAEGKSQVSTKPSEPTTGPGKENASEIWDLGDKPPKSVFLTDAEIKMKKDIFKDNPWGFHEIKTKDGKVIDVVANNNPDTGDPPLVGFITVGEGEDAKTTSYQYKEVIKIIGDKKKIVKYELVSKKEYNPLDDPNLQTGGTQVAKDTTDQVSKFQKQQPGPQKEGSGAIGGKTPTEQPPNYSKGTIGGTKPTPPSTPPDPGTPTPPPGKGGTGGLSDVTVNSRKITLTFWDHKTVDGDIINIYLNKRLIARNIRLKKSKRSLRVQLNSGKNRFEVEAVNEGSLAPNTASVHISNVTAGSETQIARRKSGQRASMNLHAP